MIVLDTDHLSVFADQRDARHELLNRRLEAVEDPVVLAIVSVEEVLRGWLALIHRPRDLHRQVAANALLGRFLDFASDWDVVPFNESAAGIFASLRRQRIRIGTMDLKIASTALAYDAQLVMANLRDFSAVPGLRCENWLEN